MAGTHEMSQLSASVVDGERQTDSSQNNSYSEQELQPIVFHCFQCSVVVGDSLSWASADNELRTITLSRTSIYFLSFCLETLLRENKLFISLCVHDHQITQPYRMLFD